MNQSYIVWRIVRFSDGCGFVLSKNARSHNFYVTMQFNQEGRCYRGSYHGNPQEALAEVLPRFLRIAVVAPTIVASFPVELHGHIEVMRPDIFAQDKTAAVRELDDSPYNIGLIRFCFTPSEQKSPAQL